MTRALHGLVASGRSFSGHERHTCFLNTGEARFANISGVSGLDLRDDGRGVAVTDWDLDGDQDMWIVNRNGPQVRFLRNDVPTDHSFLALRLVGNGTTSNRDAIGARVEVIFAANTKNPKSEIRNPKLIKTLRAGEGYLAQSSKWLHFGLGTASGIDRVVVRWPGGEAETFSGLETNRRYRLVQGSGRPEPWDAPSREVDLHASTLVAPRSPSPGRHIVSTRLPTPAFEYETFDGVSRQISPREGRAVLINVWASWCASCRKELTEWTEHAASLRDAGLDIVALTVDGLASEGTSEPADARRVLDRMAFPFETGVASAEFLEKVEILQQFLIVSRRPFAVPVSLLLDGRGRLTTIYRGPVDVDTLLADVSRIEATSPDEVLQVSLFEGQWAARSSYSLGELAARFGQQFPEEEMHYLQYAVDVDETVGRDPLTSEARFRKIKNRLPRQRARLATLLIEYGRIDEAVEQCRAGLTLFPEDLQLHALSIECLIRQGRYGEAIDAYRKTLKRRPGLERYASFGRLLEKSERTEAALAELTTMVNAEPTNPLHWFRLAYARIQVGETNGAIESLKKVLALDPLHTDARVGLAIILEKRGDTDGAAEEFNHLAWRLATHSDNALRDGKGAVNLASKVNQLTQGQNHRHLLTLAAAHAEAGQFDRAMTAAEQALAQARQAGDAEAMGRVESAMKNFQQQKPCRDQRP
jgi:tetratricopeptide (TPR) repeat protein/thiol-disulfide isomerase/thioredoxin